MSVISAHVSLYVLAQNGIDGRLVTATLFLEKIDDVRVKAECQLFFCARPEDSLFKKILVQSGIIVS